MSIPKIIHYCWFGGGALPESAVRCIESWKRHCPDYEIREWNEKNSDLESCAYVREAYAAKKWAFVSDVIRLQALSEHGGIYMDTDVELLRPLDGFLQHDAFTGFETPDTVMTGLLACRPGHELFRAFLATYDGAAFLRPDGTPDVTPNVERLTALCRKHGLRTDNTRQTVQGLTVYPREYFSPGEYDSPRCQVTEHTCAIHHFEGSWLSEEERLVLQLKRSYSGRMPKKAAAALARFRAAKRYRGTVSAVKEIAARLLRS